MVNVDYEPVKRIFQVYNQDLNRNTISKMHCHN